MTEPTSGEWAYVGNGHIATTLPSGYSRAIAQAYSTIHGSPGIEPDALPAEADANAYLMAASKRLLEACEAVVNDLARSRDHEYEEPYVTVGTLNKVFNAIAKAKGESR